jgi:hypothetical protein
MKMPQQRLFIIIMLAVIITCFSCKKHSDDPSYKNEAVIVGYDMTKCGCCGGYQFTIGSLTPTNGGDYFLVQTLPPNFQIDMNGLFPILVKMDWELISPTVCNTFISVSRISRR